MLEVMVLSRHCFLSSKIVRPRAPCGAQCMGHAIRTWSAVCSEAPHLQFCEGTRPYLCIDKWGQPTLVCKQLSLTKAVQGKLIATGLVPVLGMKTWSLDYPCSTPGSIYNFPL